MAGASHPLALHWPRLASFLYLPTSFGTTWDSLRGQFDLHAHKNDLETKVIANLQELTPTTPAPLKALTSPKPPTTRCGANGQ
jgi:hypothetical protein